MGVMMHVSFDSSSFQAGASELDSRAKKQQTKALTDIANETLRLSSYEVPHDTGALQNSGTVETIAQDEVAVGYNKVYAARLHEHPEYHFQKGRKGKYLEDPIKNNLSTFERFFGQAMEEILK